MDKSRQQQEDKKKDKVDKSKQGDKDKVDKSRHADNNKDKVDESRRRRSRLHSQEQDSVSSNTGS